MFRESVAVWCTGILVLRHMITIDIRLCVSSLASDVACCSHSSVVIQITSKEMQKKKNVKRRRNNSTFRASSFERMKNIQMSCPSPRNVAQFFCCSLFFSMVLFSFVPWNRCCFLNVWEMKRAWKWLIWMEFWREKFEFCRTFLVKNSEKCWLV